MKEANYEELKMLQSSELFKDKCENSPYAYDIVDLADWIDYVCEGRKISEEKKTIEHDYYKIDKDIAKRSGGTLLVKEEFCNDTLKDIDNFQNNMDNIQSEFRSLMTMMTNGISELN